MKITIVFINKEGAPMALNREWPELDITHAGSSGEAEGMRLEWVKETDRAKLDAVPLERFELLSQKLREGFCILCDSFMEVDIHVEFVRQWKWLDGWRDCNEQEFKERIANNNKTRTIARVVPEKAECKHCVAKENQDCQHGGGECPWADEAASWDWRGPEKAENGAHSYTESMELDTLTPAQINDECQRHNDELVKQLAAAQKRVKELEDYLADRITAPTKSMILSEFHKKWAHNPERDIINALDTVLDELGIK